MVLEWRDRVRAGALVLPTVESSMRRLTACLLILLALSSCACTKSPREVECAKDAAAC